MREKLTLWQRSVLALMYTVERERGGDQTINAERVIALFPRGTLEALLEFDWQGYHTSAMQELEEQGWITTRLASGRAVGYYLTCSAEVHLWQKHNKATCDVMTLTEEQINIPF